MDRGSKEGMGGGDLWTCGKTQVSGFFSKGLWVCVCTCVKCSEKKAKCLTACAGWHVLLLFRKILIFLREKWPQIIGKIITLWSLFLAYPIPLPCWRSWSSSDHKSSEALYMEWFISSPWAAHLQHLGASRKTYTAHLFQ